MNKEYMYVGDKVIITNDDGQITKKDKGTNTKEILEVENKIEGIENDIKDTKYKINYFNKLKKNLKDFALFSIVLWPALFFGVYQIGTPMVSTIKDVIITGTVYSFISLTVASGIGFVTNKEIRNHHKLLAKQDFELENNKQELKELKLSNNKVNNNIENEKIYKLDLEQLKKYRAKIFAEHYFNLKKDKIIILTQKNKLRKKFLMDYNNDYIYDELENMVEKDQVKVKSLKKKI